MSCGNCQRALEEVVPDTITVSRWSGNIDSSPLFSRSSILHHSFDALKDASKCGCHLCSLIVCLLTEDRLRELPADFQTGLHVQSSENKAISISISVEFFNVEGVHTRTGFELADCKRELENPPPRLARILRCSHPAVNETTGSDLSLDLAAYWLDQCLKTHTDCRKYLDIGTFFPTRAIDVGPADGSRDPHLYDCSSRGMPKDDRRYIALSHCWRSGQGVQVLTTERATFHEHQRGIPISKFPKTFLDAIAVTRKLGFRYLWIDSLCIIQGDVHDWSREASRMSDVYRNAVFTIGAARAWNSSIGCFVARNPLPIWPFEVCLPANDNQKQKCLLLFSPFDHDDYTLREVEEGTSALFTRAWVFQEQILSPRMLLFDKDQIHWECPSLHASERQPQGGCAMNFDDHWDIRRRIFETQGGENFFDLAHSAMFHYWPVQHVLWSRPVINYTHRGMTRSSDRLAGIAGAIQRQTRDTYLAGLWRNQIHCDLLWYMPFNPWDLRSRLRDYYTLENSTRQIPAIAPSWSWASVTLPISYGSALATAYPLTPMCTFEDVKVDGDPCCLFGKLTITGDVRTFQIRSVYPYWWIERCNPTFRGEGVAEYHSTQFDPEHFFLAARHGDTSCHLIPGCWHPDEVVGPETPITFIAVSQCSRPAFGRTGYDRDSYIVHALGLVPAEKARAQQLNGEKQEARLFRRVGHAEFHHCAWFGYWCDHEPGPDAIDVPWLWDPRETVGCGVSGTGRPLFSSPWVADGEGVHAHPIHADPLPGRMAYHGDVDVQTLTVEII